MFTYGFINLNLFGLNKFDTETTATHNNVINNVKKTGLNHLELTRNSF